MTHRCLRCALALPLAFLVLSWVAQPSWGLIEMPYTLAQVCKDSTNIVALRIEKVDKEKNLIWYRKVKDLKGKHGTEVVKHTIGKAGFHPREWQYIMAWAAEGKTAVFFHHGGASETCIGDYWYQSYAGNDWWAMSHGEPYLLRTFSGSTDKLSAAVTEMLAEREVIVPCLADGNKDDLHERKGRLQWLRTSLKRLDYQPKRDFVGWVEEKDTSK